MSYLLKRADTKSRCIWKIMSSKYLMAEHVEVVEVCYNFNINIDTVQKLVLPRKTVCAGCVLTIAATTLLSPTYVTPPWHGVISATSAFLFGAIVYEDFVHYREVREITRIIESIEQYYFTINKMLAYITQTNYCNLSIPFFKDNASEIIMIRISAESCKQVICDIYGYIKKIEEKTELCDKFEPYYDPVESFENCNAFQNNMPDFNTTKVLYNIFLYMQSHCLLRLSLAILSGGKMRAINAETNQLIDCLNRHTVALTKDMIETTLTLKNDRMAMVKEKDTKSKKLSMVKQQSLELTVKLMANLQQIMKLDENIQNLVSSESCVGRSQLQQASVNLVHLQSYLSTRKDECERLLITINNMLSTGEDGKQHLKPQAPVEQSQEGVVDETINVVPSAANEQQDEFFVNTGAKGEQDANDAVALGQYRTTEEELVAKRWMKSQFHPVLQQLVERLAPVEVSFRERERVALERKGIILQDDEVSRDGLKIARQLSISDTDDASDVEELEAIFTGQHRNQNKYKMDRDFLAGKQQISILTSLPKGVEMEEDILE